MRKLTELEESAYRALCREGSVLVAGDELQPIAQEALRRVMDGLVKKKRATVEATDAGPRYHPIVRAL